jgi:DNA-binding protein H-NS
MNDRKGEYMSDEIKNEDVIEESPVIPAMLQPGEPLISIELAEKYTAAVKEQKEKAEKSKPEPVVEAESELEQEPEPELAVDKPVLAEEPSNVITSGSQRSGKPKEEVAGLVSITNGVIGTGSVKPKPKAGVKVNPKPKEDKVAVYSSKNVTWNGVGKVYKGYNIVTEEVANKWLTRDHIRLATPAEVAQEFGK